jgi:hypothetical protein
MAIAMAAARRGGHTGGRPAVTCEDWNKAMKIGLKQSVLSTTVFVGILMGLVSVDPRVRDRFAELFYGSGGAAIDNRLADLGGALLDAARYQSIENAPLVVFAAVSSVLVLFMWRT